MTPPTAPQGSPDMEKELREYKGLAIRVMEDIQRTFGYRYSTSPKSLKPCKYIWMVHGESHCDIRRYAYSHQEAVSMVSNPRENWNLYKLVRVNKRKVKP